MSDFTLVNGDMRDALQAMEKESIDAIVCDPPYHLTQVSRGGSARSNGGAGPFSRHRVGATGFMGQTWDGGDVAFDPDTWAECYRVLKEGGRLLAFGGSRTAHRIWCAIEDAGFTIEDTIMWLYGSGFPKHRSKLKPGYEPICVARKGKTTDLNIDGARIPGIVNSNPLVRNTSSVFTAQPQGDTGIDRQSDGRWPANVVLDEESATEVDEQSGERVSGFPTAGQAPSTKNTYGQFAARSLVGYADVGGASRFYYCAKPDQSERNHGLEGMTKQVGGSHRVGTGSIDSKDGRDAPRANHHPTVKPVDLMRWLVRLVTLPGQTVLDPFTGSGTTGVACIQEGRNFVGVELSEEYTEIARRRIGSAPLNLFGGVV